MSTQDKVKYQNLLTLYERFILEGVRDGEITPRVKEELMNLLLTLDRETIKERLHRAKHLVEERVRAAELIGAQVLVVDARLTYRGLFGSSGGMGESIFEVGMSWDPVLDLPIIPGSSIKGATRAFCEDLLVSKGAGRGSASEVCATLFGKSGEGGYVGVVAFADALPVKAGLCGGVIDADIINPHYNALTNESLKTELDVMPVPVLHLCVCEGTVFRFLAYVPKRVDTWDEGLAKDIEELRTRLGIKLPESLSLPAKAILLMSALLGGALRVGIGARTLKGYGRFEFELCRVLTHA